jgi:hypothetical protein
MGRAAAEYAKSKQKPGKPSGQAPRRSPQEQLALKKLRKEARAAGATLETNGEGGLPSSLVLGRMRKDKYRCTNENCPDPKKDLTVDHISGHPKEIAADPGARRRKDLKRGIKAGHVNTMDAIHTICATCHDSVHDREREISKGEKPEPMPGSKA